MRKHHNAVCLIITKNGVELLRNTDEGRAF